MIISSWNVNSVRARIENIQEYLKKFSPDILMMQEIKTPDETYPYDDIKSLKYENYVFGQKSYNGVAIISKKKLNNIQKDIFKDKNKQSRIISAEIVHKKKNIILINVIVFFLCFTSADIILDCLFLSLKISFLIPSNFFLEIIATPL